MHRLVVCVAVGCAGETTPLPSTDGGTPDSALVVDGGCSGWCREPLPSGSEVLKAVWGTSASDVWAVGLDGVILHFDGARWLASTSPTKRMLNGVWGSGSSDVWAAGGDTTGGQILHFDGKVWSLSTTPPAKSFTGVYASSKSDAWAVSESGEVAHFDGTTWTLATSAAPVSWGIHGTSPSDVWIAGSDGRTWHGGVGGFTELGAPVSGKSITHIFALSTTEAFAVGFDALVLRFTAGAWSAVRPPKAGGGFVWSVSATASNDVWLVGNNGYLQRYDGAKFQYFDIERVGTRTFDGHFHGVWATPRDVFAVGETAIFHLRR